eukprot:gene28092-36983_t
MPALSPTMAKGTVGKWLCKPGDKISPGDSLAEVETDKASMAFEAQDDFYVAKLLIESGLEVNVGDPILITVENESDVSAFASYVLPVSIPAIVDASESKSKSSTPPVPSTPIVPPPVAPATPVVSRPAPQPASAVVATPTIEKPSAPLPSSSSSSSIPPALSSATGLHFVKWSGSSSGGGALASKLLSNQKAYNEKYGRSGNKLSSK